MNAQNIGGLIMSKWEKWYNNQNETTRAWLDKQAQEDNKLIFLGMLPGFILGFVFATLLLL